MDGGTGATKAIAPENRVGSFWKSASSMRQRSNRTRVSFAARNDARSIRQSTKVASSIDPPPRSAPVRRTRSNCMRRRVALAAPTFAQLPSSIAMSRSVAF